MSYTSTQVLRTYADRRRSPGYSPLKMQTRDALNTMLFAFNAACSLLSAYDDTVCVSTALFGSIRNVASLVPCLCSAGRRCARSMLGRSSSNLQQVLRDDTDSLLLSVTSAPSAELLYVLFSARFWSSPLVWQLVADARHTHIASTLIALDMPRTLRVFASQEHVSRETLRSKNVPVLMQVLDYMNSEPRQRSNVASLVDSITNSALHAVDATEVTAYSRAVFTLLTSGVFVRAPLGNALNYAYSAPLLDMFAKARIHWQVGENAHEIKRRRLFESAEPVFVLTTDDEHALRPDMPYSDELVSAHNITGRRTVVFSLYL